MIKKLVTLSGLVLGFSPIVSLAQITTGVNPTGCGTSGTVDTINGLLCKISELLGAVVPVLMALGVVYFVYGVVMYVIADDEEAKAKGRNTIIAGIVGFAVIIALWGLVRILVKTFVPSQNNSTIVLPTL